jgi:ribosomal protein S1
MMSGDLAEDRWVETPAYSIPEATLSVADDPMQRFGDYLDPVRQADWERARNALPAGVHVTGEVTARAIFGVFLDIGVGFPALIPVPHLNPSPKRRPVVLDDYPAIGSTLTARVVGFDEQSRQIGLTQLRPHPFLDRESGTSEV